MAVFSTSTSHASNAIDTAHSWLLSRPLGGVDGSPRDCDRCDCERLGGLASLRAVWARWRSATAFVSLSSSCERSIEKSRLRMRRSSIYPDSVRCSAVTGRRPTAAATLQPGCQQQLLSWCSGCTVLLRINCMPTPLFAGAAGDEGRWDPLVGELCRTLTTPTSWTELMDERSIQRTPAEPADTLQTVQTYRAPAGSEPAGQRTGSPAGHAACCPGTCSTCRPCLLDTAGWRRTTAARTMRR